MFSSPFDTEKKTEAKMTLDLSFLPVDDPEWEEKFNSLMKDEYLSRKYNREKRIKDHIDYLNNLCPELFQNGPHRSLNVVDIGPGPGELMEIARALGYNSIGFDAKLDDCEMGVPYIKLSKLLVDRQKLDVRYCGFENVLSELPVENNSTILINSRGSIEQVFKKHLTGVPHKQHHNARQLTWSLSTGMINDFTCLFTEAARILVSGGFFIIHGNGATNIDDYHKMILRIVDDIEELVCDASDNQTLHRIRKI